MFSVNWLSSGQKDRGHLHHVNVHREWQGGRGECKWIKNGCGKCRIRAYILLKTMNKNCKKMVYYFIIKLSLKNAAFDGKDLFFVRTLSHLFQ